MLKNAVIERLYTARYGYCKRTNGRSSTIRKSLLNRFSADRKLVIESYPGKLLLVSQRAGHLWGSGTRYFAPPIRATIVS